MDQKYRLIEKKDKEELEFEIELKQQKTVKKARLEKISTLLNKEKCQKLGLQEFKNILKDDELLGELSKKILDDFYKSDVGFKVSDMKDLLKFIDRNLFMKLTDNQLTLDQLKTRIFEKIQMKTDSNKYYCPDDLKQLLGEELFNFDPAHVDEYIKMIYHKETKDLTAEEANTKLEPWQTNQKCLRSIYNLGVKVLSVKEKKRRKKLSQELNGTQKNKIVDASKLDESQTNLSSGRRRNDSGISHSKKRINTASIFNNVANVKKKDEKQFIEKIKETLKIFHKIKMQRDKFDVVRNYGPQWELEQIEDQMQQERENINPSATVQFQKQNLSQMTKSHGGRGSGEKSKIFARNKSIQAQQAYNQEVRQNCGFLKRLDDVGAHIKMDQEVGDILFFEEREKEIKEKMMEEYKKKTRKPRPRDYIDFDKIQEQNHKVREVIYKRNAQDINHNKTSIFKTEKNSIIARPIKKSMIGGFKFSQQHNDTSKISDSFSQTTTTATVDEQKTLNFNKSQKYSRNISSAGGQQPQNISEIQRNGRRIRPKTSVKPLQFNETFNSIITNTQEDNETAQKVKFKEVYNREQVIEEEFDNYIMSNFQYSNRRQDKHKSIVSDKFMSYLSEVGIPVGKQMSTNYSNSHLNQSSSRFDFPNRTQNFQTQAMIYRINQNSKKDAFNFSNDQSRNKMRTRLESAKPSNQTLTYQDLNHSQDIKSSLNKRRMKSWYENKALTNYYASTSATQNYKSNKVNQVVDTHETHNQGSSYSRMGKDARNDLDKQVMRNQNELYEASNTLMAISPKEWKHSVLNDEIESFSPPVNKLEKFNVDVNIDQNYTNNNQDFESDFNITESLNISKANISLKNTLSLKIDQIN
eukprot:403336849